MSENLRWAMARLTVHVIRAMRLREVTTWLSKHLSH